MKILVTGSAGLVGSAVVARFAKEHHVTGLDNNQRESFFGREGSTREMAKSLSKRFSTYLHLNVDIRNERMMNLLFKESKFDAVVHCAAQPSHDKAAEIPLIDFDVNARATLVLLEAMRSYAPEAVFVFMSTNKVYGDLANIPTKEFATRFDFDCDVPEMHRGIDEETPIDRTMHSLFGCSKAAADLLVQEYGRYFGLRTVVFRAGCMTGEYHAGVAQHGFLAYMAKCAREKGPYGVMGYKGKQVRDNIHSEDVASAIEQVIMDPPGPGAVYNLGGERRNSISLVEAAMIFAKMGKPMDLIYHEEPRRGDHKVYITNMSLFRAAYPDWEPKIGLEEIFKRLIFI